MSRRVLGVIGIIDAQEWPELTDALEEFNTIVTGLRFIPLATRCYAFDLGEGQTDEVKGVVVVPDIGGLAFYMGTLLVDLAASILHELSNLVGCSFLVQNISQALLQRRSHS